MAGRLPKLTPEAQTAICKALAAGNNQAEAAAAADVNPATLYKWLQRGRKETKGIYHDLAVAVEKAQARAIRRNVKLIQRAARDHWQAAAWWLERKYPELWGRDTREIKELRSLVADLLRRIESLTERHPPPQDLPAPHPDPLPPGA